MKTAIDLSKIYSLDDELNLFETMTDDQVIETYNVDCRKEALPFIRDWWIMMDDSVVDEDAQLEEALQHIRDQWEMMN